MRRVAFAVVVGSVAGLMLVGGPGRASLYSPEDQFDIPVGEDGKAKPLDFKAAFKPRLVGLTTALDPRKTDGKYKDDHKKFLDRIEKREGKKLSPEETAALAVDLLRIGRLDEALDRIKPRVIGRNRGYLDLTTLAHVHAARGEWREAVDYQMAALLDSEMPAVVKGLTKPQRDWIAKLDQDYVLPYFLLRLKESTANPRPDPGEEDVPPLFPVAERGKPHDPVRFVNDAGKYEPGNLAAAERAKLPPDAIAIVQQLLLWFPTDTRLYWLLAELYAAEGNVHVAQDIMDSCVSEARQFGNRRVLMEHRAEVRRIAATTKPPTSDDVPLMQPTKADQPPPPQPTAPPISMRTIWIYFGVVGVVALFALTRVLIRRAKGGPVG